MRTGPGATWRIAPKRPAVAASDVCALRALQYRPPIPQRSIHHDPERDRDGRRRTDRGGRAGRRRHRRRSSTSSTASKLKGFLAYDDAAKEKRPGVLVVHEWWGLNDYAKDRCKQLAELGYVAFAADMYGDGKTVDHPDDARKMADDGAREREGVARPGRGRAEGTQGAAATWTPTSSRPSATASAAAPACNWRTPGPTSKAVATFHAALPDADGGGGEGDQGEAADLPRRGRLLHPPEDDQGVPARRSTRRR